MRLSSLFRFGMTNVRLIGSDSPRLVVARQKLDRVLARQQREAGVVLDGPLGQLGGGRVAQLDVHLVAHVLMVVPYSSLISPMKSISVCSAPPLRASASSLPGIFTDDRHEILGAVQLEVIDLHRDGQLGDRDRPASARLPAAVPCRPR